MPELSSNPPYFLVSRTPNSTTWASLINRDESHCPRKVCVATSMELTQFLSSPVGKISWAGLTTLSQLNRKDKGGFQTTVSNTTTKKGLATTHNRFTDGWWNKEEKLQKNSLSVKARFLCWRYRIKTNIVGEGVDLWTAVPFSGSNRALQPTSHKKHRPSHFLLTFIPPLFPLHPAALFCLCLLHSLAFSAPLFHPPCFLFRLSTQLPFLSSL